MTRHGIVVPLPNVVPPPDCKGGPAFCAVCNAEMIEVETRAILMAVAETFYHWKAYGSFEEERAAAVEAVHTQWARSPKYPRRYRERVKLRIAKALLNTPEVISERSRLAAMAKSPEWRRWRAKQASLASVAARKMRRLTAENIPAE